MEKPYFSLIIPAHNEEKRISKTLEQAEAFLSAQSYSSEIIIVENGSTDQTATIAHKFADTSDRISVLEKKLPGKGSAVRSGMLAANGAYRFMADADLSMPINEIPGFLNPALEEYDIIIGSRKAPGAIRKNEPEYRHIGGRAVNLMIRLFALPDFHDTQCGFKLFKAKAAETLFQQQTINGWSFDIEILFMARLQGYKIYELPIPWHHEPDSKVSPFKDGVKMMIDILKIRNNARTGHYARTNQDSR